MSLLEERPAAVVGAAAVVEDRPLSWGAVFAGAAVSVAASTFFTVLGAGFGYTLAPGGLATHGSLAGFSPEVGAGAVAAQCVAAGLGGYIAGRLRPPGSGAHGDEAHFRDTAHGLISWAVATVAGVLLAALVIAPYAAALAGAAAQAAATAPVSTADAVRASEIAAQSSFFTAVGLIVSAFVAAVAARVGGERSEHMRARFLA